MTAAVEGGEWSAAHPGRTLPLAKKTLYSFYRRLVGPRPGLDRYGKSHPYQDSIADCPARSRSLY